MEAMEAAKEESLSKAQIIEKFEAFVKSEEVWNHRTQVKEWKSLFFALTNEEETAQKKAFEENKEEGDTFEFESNSLDNRWKELFNIYKDKLAAHKKEVLEQEKQNLSIKEDLVAKLKALVEADMQNVGSAFSAFYAIRDKWNEVGQVNKSKFKQLQYDYSHYRDLFYYNVGIHDQLKNYDFKKNAQQKQEVIKELKVAFEQDSIRKMEAAVKELQAKWDEIGPTSNEDWEKLKNDYWDTVNGIYDKVKIHYKALRETQAKILEEKQTIINKMDALKEDLSDFKTPKEWIALSDKMNELHAEWKAAGFLGKSKEDAIWTSFKESSDFIRDQKNTFFDALKQQNSKVVEAKNKLIEQAISLKDSTEWKKTSEELIQLQKRWKNAGQAQRKVDQKLWEKFRAACDTFFTNKKEYYDTLEDRQEANFVAKEKVAELIAKSKSEEELRSLIGEWQSIDYVPKKKIAASDASFNKAVKSAADKLKIDAEALNMLRFEAKVSALKEDDNSEIKLKSEREFVKTQMDKIKEEIHRFEENMGFFGHSKGSQKLKEIVELRMKDAEAKLTEWQEKLKMLR